MLAALRSSDGLAATRTRSLLSQLVHGRCSFDPVDPAPARPPESPSSTARALGDGPGALHLTTPALASRLAAAAVDLTAAGLPATFLYLFEDPWQLGADLAAHVSSSLGRRYVVADDVWAWVVPPGRRGWPAHRGLATEVLDREAPELVNTWVALSDVEADRACMSFVPLARDPAYPHDLASIAVPPGAGAPVPLVAGQALAWNANVLHWGGAHTAATLEPRVSCSFSLVREDAAARLGLPLAGPDRLDAVARQIVVYGDGQPDVRPEVLAWARAAHAMKAAIQSLSGDLPRL